MTHATDSIRAAIYARVSSDQQAEAGTIASQVAALEERLAARRLDARPELRFLDEGYSGSTLVRPALERLRDAAANGAIDRLYVHSPDRLARKYAYQVLLVDEFQRCGVELIFLNRELGRVPGGRPALAGPGHGRRVRAGQDPRTQPPGQAARRPARLGQRPERRALRLSLHQQVGRRGTARYEVVLEEARVVRQIFTWVGQERCPAGRGLPALAKARDSLAQGEELLGPRRRSGACSRTRPISGRPGMARPASVPGGPGPRTAAELRRSNRGGPTRSTTAKTAACPSRCRPWSTKPCSRPWPSNWTRIAAVPGNGSVAPATCSRACWCASAAAMPCTASR